MDKMIIDAHVHLWPRCLLPDEAVKNYLAPLEEARKLLPSDQQQFLDFFLDEASPFKDYDLNVSEVINTMNYNKIDYVIALAVDFGLVNEGRITNEEYTDWLYREASVDDRIIPFISVDPNRGEAGLKMIESFVKKYNPPGIKMYPATGFYPDSEKCDKYWDLVDDLGLVVVTHAGMAFSPLDERYCHPVNMERVADNHPDTKFIIAHMGGKFGSELPGVMRRHENIYTDCSAMQGWLPGEPDVATRKISTFVTEFPDRVVYGSDFPLYEMRYSSSLFIRLINEGDWGTERMKEGLMGNNMARILGL